MAVTDLNGDDILSQLYGFSQSWPGSDAGPAGWPPPAQDASQIQRSGNVINLSHPGGQGVRFDTLPQNAFGSNWFSDYLNRFNPAPSDLAQAAPWLFSSQAPLPNPAQAAPPAASAAPPRGALASGPMDPSIIARAKMMQQPATPAANQPAANQPAMPARPVTPTPASAYPPTSAADNSGVMTWDVPGGGRRTIAMPAGGNPFAALFGGRGAQAPAPAAQPISGPLATNAPWSYGPYQRKLLGHSAPYPTMPQGPTYYPPTTYPFGGT